MKRLGKVFLGMLCMILLFAFSHASAENICAPEPKETKEKVKFEWDPVRTYTTGREIKGGKVTYVVYVYSTEDICKKPPIQEEKIDETRLKVKVPIDTNDNDDTISCVIPFDDEDKGKDFFLGVQALLYRVSIDGKIIDKDKPVSKSTISWSCCEKCTKINPQYVKVLE